LDSFQETRFMAEKAKHPPKKNAAKPKAASATGKARKPASRAKPLQKPTAKKAPAKKAPAKKAPAKKAPAKKASAKKPSVKAPAARKTSSRPAPSSSKASLARPAAAKPAALAKSAGRDGKPSGKVPVKKLTAKEVGEFKALLLGLRDRINNDIEFMSGDHRNRSEWSEGGSVAPSADTVDQGSDAFDREFMMTLMSSEQDIIYEIQEALRRVEHGTYGICEISGEPIEKERLKVIPYARHCVRVQSELEKGRGFRRRHGGARVPAGFAFETEGDGE